MYLFIYCFFVYMYMYICTHILHRGPINHKYMILWIMAIFKTWNRTNMLLMRAQEQSLNKDMMGPCPTYNNLLR